MERMSGVAAMGVGWASGSGEDSDLAGPPLNLVLYMHLRIFAYTSNKYSNCQFRVCRVYASLWYVEELQVLAEVLLVH